MDDITISTMTDEKEIEFLRDTYDKATIDLLKKHFLQALCEKLGFTKWENPQWKEGITYKLLF